MGQPQVALDDPPELNDGLGLASSAHLPIISGAGRLPRDTDMTQTVTAADAKVRFDELVERVAETGERVIVTTVGGNTIAMIPSADLEQLPPSPMVAGAKERLGRLHEMLRAELGGRPLDPDPVAMLRRVRDGEFE